MFWIYIYTYIYIHTCIYIYYIYYQEHILPGYPPGLIPPAVGVSSGSTLLSQLMARKALELPEQSEHVTTTCREVCWMGGTIPILWSFTQIYIYMYICLSIYLSMVQLEYFTNLKTGVDSSYPVRYACIYIYIYVYWYFIYMLFIDVSYLYLQIYRFTCIYGYIQFCAYIYLRRVV